MAESSGTRKIDSECRAFEEEWTSKYFFTIFNGKLLCLVCQEKISVSKEYNLRRHFETKHKDLSKLNYSERKLKLPSLLKNFSGQQQFFKKAKAESEAATRASFLISKEIAASGKPFLEGEFIKKCLLMAASELCPEKKTVFENLSLARMTVQRRVSEISGNLKDQLIAKAKQFSYYSIAMDESTDIRDTAQLLVFVRGIDASFEITEELLGMCSMGGRTTGKEISEEVRKCITEKMDMSFKNLVSICTDGAPSMCGKNAGAVALLEEIAGRKLTKYHCIIHQQVLCSKVLNYSHVISVVTSVVNYLRARGLKHRTFCTFLEEMDAEFGDLLYHTEVRWLSKGRVLQRFVAIKEEIRQFLENDPKDFPPLKDKTWNNDLHFLTDMTAHLNQLNLQLQGKSQLIFELLAAVEAFKRKLVLFKGQLLQGDFSHFQTCQKYMQPSEYIQQGKKYVGDVEILMKEFNRRLDMSSTDDKNLKFIEDPFSVTPKEAPAQLQLEIIELQCSAIYKAKHRESQLLDFYKSLDREKFPNLCDMAMQAFSIFGSTYICEKTFSAMNLNKSKARSRLNNSNLEDILRTSTSNLVPEYDKLVSEKRCNTSHQKTSK